MVCRGDVDDLDGNLTPALGGEQFRLLVKNLETIRTQCGNLEVVSERMGLT